MANLGGRANAHVVRVLIEAELTLAAEGEASESCGLGALKGEASACGAEVFGVLRSGHLLWVLAVQPRSPVEVVPVADFR